MLDVKSRETIRMMADYDMNVTEISRRCNFHRNTIEYRIEQIRKKTGLDPKRFYDLIKLVEMVEAEEQEERWLRILRENGR